MTREEKIKDIYKEMANKELTFGCKVKFSKGIYSIIDRENVGFLNSYKGKDGNIHNTIVIEDGINSRCYNIKEIIGHPVMIGDVLDHFEDKRFYCGKCKRKVDKREEPDHNCGKDYYYYIFDEDSPGPISDRILSRWENKRAPIEDQSNECVNYIYSLIQKD